MRLLITGASGLVGAKLAQTASSLGHETFETFNQHQIDRPKALRIDIRNNRNVQAILKETSPDVTVHLASITDVDLCEQQPELANSINAVGTQILAQECFKMGAHFVYVSTDYVFDGVQGNYREDDSPNPVNIYGRSKLNGEQITRATSEEFTVARTSVVYGWGRTSRPNFGSWAYSELTARRSLKVVVDQYCSPTLNSHLARMLLEVAENQLPGTIHLAGASRLSRYEFARALANELGAPTALIVQTSANSSTWRAKRPSDSSLSVERARQLLTNKPVDISSALREFVLEATSRNGIASREA